MVIINIQNTHVFAIRQNRCGSEAMGVNPICDVISGFGLKTNIMIGVPFSPSVTTL